MRALLLFAVCACHAPAFTESRATPPVDVAAGVDAAGAAAGVGAGADARDAAAGADAAGAAPSTGSLREAAQAAGLGWPPPELEILVEKRARRLTVLSGARPLVQWPVGLGGVDADKVRQGDRATPEGSFRVVTRNDRSRFHLFLGLSYPTADDAERGVQGGLISESQARAIREAEAQGRVPPWNTRLGGAIGLHGGGGTSDWTLGCVAVENAQIEELWEVAPLGTVVRIAP